MQDDYGWIKIHRELLNKPIWQLSTPEQKTILITLLMLANHREKKWEWNGGQYVCEPGQFITSLNSLVEVCGEGITIQNVRTALNRFEKYDFLTNVSTKRGRLITIVNWEKYQCYDIGSNKESGKEANKDLTKGKYEQSVNFSKNTIFLTELLTKHGIDKNAVESILSEFENNSYNKASGKDLTKSQQRPNKRLTPNKNIKNDKNKKNNIKTLCTPEADALFEHLWNRYPSKKGKARITDKKKREFLEVGEEQMNRCIDRYLADLKKDDWRHPQNGSTFFTSGYVDYLDKNYGNVDNPKKGNSPADRFACLRPETRSALEESGVIQGQSIAIGNASEEQIRLLQKEGLL